MATTLNYMPTDDAGKELWLKNVANKIGGYAVKYNITAAEVADVQAAALAFSYYRNYNKQFDEFKQKLTEFKNELRDGIAPGATPSILPAVPVLGAAPAAVLPGVFARVKSLVTRIKENIAYTIADGMDLGIENIAVPATDVETKKPVLNLRLVAGGFVEIGWKKEGMSGIEIHVDRGDGIFTFLARDNFPPFKDKEKLEAGEVGVWRYKAIYLKKDEPVGIWSEKVEITVTGQ